MRTSLQKYLVTLPLLLMAWNALGQNSPVAAPNDNGKSGWATPTRMTVTTRSPEIPATETLTFDLQSNGDTSVAVSYPDDAGRKEHRILLISGRWMALKDVAAERGFEIDALDGPMLTMQLVTRFLERAYPNGPDTVQKRETLKVTENFKPIRVNTVTADGGWDAPWNLQGILDRNGTTQISYDFVVLHSAPGDPNVHSIRFSGIWERTSAPMSLPDSTSMRGWKIYKLSPVTRKTGKGTTFDYGAEEETNAYATLGDLRGKTSASIAPVEKTIPEKPAKRLSIPASLSSPLQRY